MRGEELGDGGDVLGGHGALAGHDGVLFLGDVELVEPAEDFHLLPVLRITAGDELTDDGVRVQEIVRQQQDGGVVQLAEDIGQDVVQFGALGEQQQAIEFFVAVAIQLEADDFLAVESLEQDVFSVLEYFRQSSALRVAQDAVAMVQVAIVKLHEAQGDEAVEPDVGHGLHGGTEAIALDGHQELLAQRHHGTRKGLAANERDIAGLSDGFHPALLNAKHAGTPGDGVDEGGACGGREVLELG